jgi:diaminopimelate epimerase
MSGSGNDFVFFDNRRGEAEDLARAPVIGAVCDRRTGIGADGIVLIDSNDRLAFGMRYYNRDGSLAEMCGNAALCSATLARELGIVREGDFSFETPSGPVVARFLGDVPEIDMMHVSDMKPDFETPLAPGELRAGFARVGVPHLVILCEDAARVDVVARGRHLRRLPELRDGANVNFVSRHPPGAWVIRTYERGVEDETLACGTGTVATAALLSRWGLVDGGVHLETRSGRSLFATGGSGDKAPVLRGEGRIVFEREIRDLQHVTPRGGESVVAPH